MRLTSSKALRLRPDLAKVGEDCSGGESGVVLFDVTLTSEGMLCMSLLSCSSNFATWHAHSTASALIHKAPRAASWDPCNAGCPCMAPPNSRACRNSMIKAVEAAL